MINSSILLLVGSWEKHPGHLALCSSIHHSLYTLSGSWGQGMKVQNLKWKGQHLKCSLVLNLTTHQVVQKYQETRIVSITEPPDASFYCCEDQSENNRFEILLYSRPSTHLHLQSKVNDHFTPGLPGAGFSTDLGTERVSASWSYLKHVNHIKIKMVGAFSSPP